MPRGPQGGTLASQGGNVWCLGGSWGALWYPKGIIFDALGGLGGTLGTHGGEKNVIFVPRGLLGSTFVPQGGKFWCLRGAWGALWAPKGRQVSPKVDFAKTIGFALFLLLIWSSEGPKGIPGEAGLHNF